MARRSIAFRVTNDMTQRSKNVRISNADALGSIYQALYEHEGLQEAGVREWPSEFQSELDEGMRENQFMVMDKNEEAVKIFTQEEMKATSVEELLQSLEEAEESDDARIHLVLRCKKVSSSTSPRSVTVSPGVETETAPPTASPTQTSSGSGPDLRRGVRVRITNSLTSRSKNVRISPESFNDSIFDTVYKNPAVMEANIRNWPEGIEVELNDNLREVQIVLGDQVFSIEEAKTTTLGSLLESLSSDDDLLQLELNCEKIEQTAGQEDDDKKKAEEEEKERLRKKEEEARFWAEEEARLEAQAEERKRQKEEKLKAILAAENEAKQREKAEADAKAQADAMANAEREARRKAEKEAALRAEQEARLEAQEEAKYYAEEEQKLMNKSMDLSKNKKRASLMLETGARRSSRFEAVQKEEEEEKQKTEDLARLQARHEAVRKAEEAARREAEEEKKAIDELLVAEEEKDLDDADNQLATYDMDEMALLDAEEEKALDEFDNQLARERKDSIDSNELLEAEEEAALTAQEEDALLAADEMEELKNAEEAAAGKELTEEEKEKIEDELRLEREAELTRLIKKKETAKENARLQALEEDKARQLDEASRQDDDLGFSPPKDQSVDIFSGEARVKREGVDGRLQKVEREYVHDGRKRSTDVIALSGEFVAFRRHLKLLSNLAHEYQTSRLEMESARSKVSFFVAYFSNTS